MSSVIEGFLVTLGFAVDQDSQAKYNKSIETANKRMKAFAATAVASTAALAGAWLKTSQEINKNFNLSAKVGSTQGAVKSLQGAFKALGYTSEDATGALSAMASKLKAVPQYGEQIKNLFGVEIKDANGNLRDTTDILVDIGSAMRNMEPHIAKTKAEAAGLGGAFDALIDPRFAEAFARYEKTLKNIGDKTEAASGSTNRLMMSLGTLWDSLSTAAMSVVADFNDTFELDKKVDEWATKILESSKDLSTKMRAGVSTVLSFFGADEKEAQEEKKGQKDTLDFWSKLLDYKEWGVRYAKKEREYMEEARARESKAPAKDSPSRILDKVVNGPLGIRNKNPGNIRGDDGNFRQFSTFEDGVFAMARQLKMYQNSGAQTMRQMLSTYAPTSENNTEAYIKSVETAMSSRLGRSITGDTRLNLSDTETLNALTLAMIRHENGAGWEKQFEGASFRAQIARAADVTAKSKHKFGNSTSVTINQNIHVNGSTAPQKIAEETKKSVSMAANVRDGQRGLS